MMARSNRRDCRQRVGKKQQPNSRVEQLQKQIRKAKKAGVAPPAEVVEGLARETNSDSSSSHTQPAQLTPAAADFLSQLRADAQASVSGLRAAISELSQKEKR